MVKLNRVLVQLGVASTIVGLLWLVATTTVSNPIHPIDSPSQGKVAVAVSQLPTDKIGVIPIVLLCENAELPQPNTVDKISCRLINQTKKDVAAVNVRITITLEDAGKQYDDSGYITADALVLAGFQSRAHSLIPASGEYTITDLPTTYDGAVRKIVAEVDYVEFADHAAVGKNLAGYRIIHNTRIGAAKYRNWLIKKYEQNNRSIDSIVSLLDDARTLPHDLNFEDSHQEEGARSYQKYALRTYMFQKVPTRCVNTSVRSRRHEHATSLRTSISYGCLLPMFYWLAHKRSINKLFPCLFMQRARNRWHQWRQWL